MDAGPPDAGRRVTPLQVPEPTRRVGDARSFGVASELVI